MDALDIRLWNRATADLVKCSMQLGDAAAAMGVSVRTIRAHINVGSLLPFKHGDKTLIPTWELPPKRSGRPLPGIPELASAFGGDVLALSEWILAPNPHLRGDLPRDRLIAGEVTAVIDAVTAAGAAAF